MGCKTRFEMRNDGFENRRLGEVVPREWTFRNLGHQTNPLKVHIQFLMRGPLHSQNHPTLLPQESNFSDSGQHRHRGTDTTYLPSPQLPQFISCYVPSGFSLVGVFVFSLIASKPSISLLKAELLSGIGRLCPRLPPLPALQVFSRTTCTSWSDPAGPQSDCCFDLNGLPDFFSFWKVGGVEPLLLCGDCDPTFPISPATGVQGCRISGEAVRRGAACACALPAHLGDGGKVPRGAWACSKASAVSLVSSAPHPTDGILSV